MPFPARPFFGPKNLDLPPVGGLLMVRHAERYPILVPSEAYVAALTENGRAAARAFGEKIGQSWQIGKVVVSPASRCVDTADQILQGAMDGRRPHPHIRPLPLLHFDQSLTGIPGLAGIYLNVTGFATLASRPAAPEYALLSASLLAELPFPSEPGVINLAVTHDVIITFLKACLLGWSRATLQDFPGYLEGICLVRQDNTVHLYEGNVY